MGTRVLFRHLAAAAAALLLTGHAAQGDDLVVLRRGDARIAPDPFSAAHPPERLRLELFGDAPLDVVRDQARGPSTWTGRVAGPPAGRLTLVRRGDAIAGLLRAGAGAYRISGPPGGPLVVAEIDEAALPPCAGGLPPDAAAPQPPEGAGALCADGSVIDLIVGYTPVARDVAGSASAIEAEIALAVELTNEAYANSQISTQLNLLHVTEVQYGETGTYPAHLNALSNSNDGVMDEMHGLRYQHQADMVALIVADPSFCGIAYLLPVNAPGFDYTAFSVTTLGCAAAGLTLAHELGHNQGCCHACGDGGGCGCGGLFPYSVGYRYFGMSGTQWRTIMAYAPGVRIPNFSNPAVTHDGGPTGVPVGQAGQAHNSLTINQTRATIASHRCGLPYCDVKTFTAADGPLTAGLGYAVAGDGPILVAGAPMDDEHGEVSGAAYVFRYDGAQAAWVEDARLLPVDGEAFDLFGVSVAIRGGTILVGATGDDDAEADAGAAYVYRLDPDTGTWGFEQKLTAADASMGAAFGSSVSVSGGAAVVGAWLDGGTAAQAGSAYVFRYDGDAAAWAQEQKLLPPRAVPFGRFGHAVLVEGDLAFVGAPADLSPVEPGSVSAFRYEAGITSWELETELLASDGAGGDAFGAALSLSGDVLIAGAPLDDNPQTDAGSAYVLRHDGEMWQEEAKLIASDADFGDRFGRSVSIAGDLVVVGADGQNDNGPEGGGAYAFSGAESWQEQAKLLAPGGAMLDFFGNGVATDGRFAFAGSFNDGEQGALFAFAGFSAADCDGSGTDDACDIAAGTVPDANGNGIPDGCETVGDTNGDGAVNVTDLLGLLGAFGACNTCGDCPADTNGDCLVTVTDLLALLANWG